MAGAGSSLELIRKQLVAQEQTLGVAESVTAGTLQAALSLANQATDFFQGGLTLYNLGQKARHLGVDPILAERTNCVSDKVAATMAVGACRFFSCDWGIAITGYAAPVPEWGVKEVLYANYAFAHRGIACASGKIEVKKMAMSRVQQFYVRHILREFARYLKNVA